MAAFLLLLGGLVPAAADPGAEEHSGACKRPVWPNTHTTAAPSDRIVEATVRGVRVNVLLPVGYGEPGNTRRYPTLYVLHGGGMWVGAWLSLSDIVSFTQGLPEDQQVVVVMPDGGFGIYTDLNEGPSAWERFHTGPLISYIDETFRTIPDRAHRALAGESGGGEGTSFYLARHPDLYVAGQSISAPFTTLTMAALMQATIPLYTACPDVVDGVAMRIVPPFATDEIWYRNGTAPNLAKNFRGTSLYLASGNGVPCDPADIAAYPSVYPVLEPVARRDTVAFHKALRSAGVAHTLELAECGTHAFKYFQTYLHHFWPHMIAAFGSPDPTSFDYRRADPRFSVWGWTFNADRRRAAEFLDVTGASAAGLTLAGSGSESVTSAPYFMPGQIVVLSGAVESSAVADDDGRIRFHVDLGPAHKHQQYTPIARILEAAGDYFISRTVTFAPQA